MTKEGLPINSMYMYVADRIIQTDDDLAIVNDMLAKNPDAFSQLGGVPQKGDILFKDLNGDNKIDPTNDRDIVETPTRNICSDLICLQAIKGLISPSLCKEL